ncbi:MAG: DUF5916 domain-containing protein [Vicinamibacterales bacterium]
MTTRFACACATILLLAGATHAAGQAVAPAFDGPAAPMAPAVLARDSQGRVTVRAVRLASPLTIDGTLSEPTYEVTESMGGFIQNEPSPGAPATERTEVWLFFDGDNVYISARCWDSDPSSIVSTELRRDNNTIFNGNDIIAIALDTFHDGRNSLLFTINPSGGRQDGQVTNERQYNGDWNPIWRVQTARFDQGWTLEMALPFKSIRYGGAPGQLWGLNVMRVKRSKVEVSFLSQVPPARGQQAVQQVSMAATVTGLELPTSARPLDLKPYVTSSLTSDLRATRPSHNVIGSDVGLDAKYALTKGVTGDLTVRTDFAQVEADEQQVNLTRFSLFFPEKREFFLENQGMFGFGGVSSSGQNAGQSDAPILFYSRRIGLNQGRVVPLEVGGRVTGQAGGFGIGLLSIQTGDDSADGRPATTPSTNFSVVRLKKDVLRRSSIGVIATNRTVLQTGQGANRAYGVDGSFSFFQNLLINTYWARTDTDGLRGDARSYRAQLDYTADRYTVQAERLAIGDHFNPEIGFVRRDNMRRNYGVFKFTPRVSSPSIRKLSYGASLAYVTGGDGLLETREQNGEFGIDFLNNDKLYVSVSNLFDLLRRPFAIGPGVTLPSGGYAYRNVKVNYNMSQGHAVGANITFDRGSFYNGDKTSLSIARGRVRVSSRMSAEPTYSVNRVSLDQGRFTTHQAGARLTYTMTPLMFTSALVQYSSSQNTVSVNARLRWEYQPGSELFIVYNEERDTLARSFPDAMNRALIVKVNKLFRF